MEPRHHDGLHPLLRDVDGTPLARGPAAQHVATAASGLEVIARDRLSMANNDLAGIATDALPAVQLRLLEVIADLEKLGNEIRDIVIVLRNGHDG